MQDTIFDPSVAYHPLALLLGSSIIARITLPMPLPLEVLLAQANHIAAELKPEEKKRVLARAKWLGAYAAALEKALSKG